MMSENPDIFSRKNDHLRINLHEDVQSGIHTGFDNFILEHCALPEFSLRDVDLSTTFLGFALKFPLLISSMTGGTKEGAIINVHLAEAAQAKGIGMGLGSQRAALEDKSVADSFNLRKYAADIPLFANIGAVQLNYGVSVDDCLRVMEIAHADGLILHLNPLQEALQPEGDTDFSNLLSKIEAVCKATQKPLIVKEVGWGISPKVAEQLIFVGVRAIDVAGAGGTSWSQVEMYRSKDEVQRRIAADFRNWGLSTAYALKALRDSQPDLPLISSGGVQNGIEIAKSLALGADICGMAGRLLLAATVSTEKVIEVINEIELETKIALFACGARTVEAMKRTKITPA